MIEVYINQETFHIPVSATLAGILPLLKIGRPDGIAIAVNDDVIPKREWDAHMLHASDKIFVIRATQGG